MWLRSYSGGGLYLVISICLLGMSSLQARSIEGIKSAGVFSICAARDALPFSKAEGTPRGLSIEIAQEIANALEVSLSVEWVWARYQAKYADCDAIVGVARDPAPGSFLRFSQPILDVEMIFVSKPSFIISAKSELFGKVVAVPSASLVHFELLNTDVELRVSYGTDLAIIEAVVAEEVDAGLVSNVALNWFLNKSPGSLLSSSLSSTVLAIPGSYPMAIGLRRSDSLSQSDYEGILADLKTTGRLESILGKYGQDLSRDFDDPYVRIVKSLRAPVSYAPALGVMEKLQKLTKHK